MAKHVLLLIITAFLLTQSTFISAQRLIGFEVVQDTLLKGYDIILDDPLTSKETTFGELSKMSFLGKFSKKGWQATHKKGVLKIGLSENTFGEGALQVTLSNVNRNNQFLEITESGKKENNQSHFISMFSNENGSLAQSDSEKDCFWSLTQEITLNNNYRKNRIKLFWSSIGLRNSQLSRFREKTNLPPENWKWDSDEYTFTIIWSKNKELLKIFINGQLFYQVDWYGQQQLLKYIYLGKADDSNSIQKTLFYDLKVYGK
jgi:hypothetical protein